MIRTAALAVAACLCGLPAAAVTVTVEFEATVDRIPFVPLARRASAKLIFVPPPLEPVGPFLGDVVSGRVSFDLDGMDRVQNVSGSAPIAGSDPKLESATVSPVERIEGCKGPSCFTIAPEPKPLVPVAATKARGTLTVNYGPNVTFTDPTFDSSVEWVDLSIEVAAALDGEPSPADFLDLLQLPGALPVAIEYTRIGRGNLFIPGADPYDCAIFGCATFGATVTSGEIRVGNLPAPIPVPPTIAALLTALGAFGAFAALRRAKA